MKYNLREIMLRAWKNYRKMQLSFAECLHRAWITAKAGKSMLSELKRRKRKQELTRTRITWNGWKQLGYEVIHGSKALFGVNLIWGSRGDGAIYKARFFGRSQVQEIITA